MSVTIHQAVRINIAVSSTEHFKKCYRTCKLFPVRLQHAAQFHYARFHREYKHLIEFEMLLEFLNVKENCSLSACRWNYRKLNVAYLTGTWLKATQRNSIQNFKLKANNTIEYYNFPWIQRLVVRIWTVVEQETIGQLLARWILAHLIYNPEDGSNTFLLNISSYTDYMALYARRWKVL
jgi:hypothetical protein